MFKRMFQNVLENTAVRFYRNTIGGQYIAVLENIACMAASKEEAYEAIKVLAKAKGKKTGTKYIFTD